MKRVAAVAAAAVLAVWIGIGSRNHEARWEGVDKSVVAKFAKEAGRSPREPFLNTDRGDLLLFLFLVAGAAGGFTGGYFFRELFPRKTPDGGGRRSG